MDCIQKGFLRLGAPPLQSITGKGAKQSAWDQLSPLGDTPQPSAPRAQLMDAPLCQTLEETASLKSARRQDLHPCISKARSGSPPPLCRPYGSGVTQSLLHPKARLRSVCHFSFIICCLYTGIIRDSFGFPSSRH